MLHRRSTQLALQATLLLAMDTERGWWRVSDMAGVLGASRAYLTKVLQGLTRVGLLRAVRGSGRGVQLARPPQEISLSDVISALEPVGELDRCFLGFERCSNTLPCALHELFAPARASLLQALQTNLEEFAAAAKRKGGCRWQWPRSNHSNASHKPRRTNTVGEEQADSR